MNSACSSQNGCDLIGRPACQPGPDVRLTAKYLVTNRSNAQLGRALDLNILGKGLKPFAVPLSNRDGYVPRLAGIDVFDEAGLSLVRFANDSAVDAILKFARPARFQLVPPCKAIIACLRGPTSALSGPRRARPARRRRTMVPRACGALAQRCHGTLQRIVRSHAR